MRLAGTALFDPLNSIIRRSALAAAALCTFAFVSGDRALANQANEAELPAKTIVTGDDEAPDKPGKKGASDKKSASREGSGKNSGGQAIVALVNDEPITGYEVQQRAAILGGGNIQQQAQANFKSIIKNPKTTERLKAILNEVVKANEGKSRDEIIAIFERRKKEFGMSLQKQAVESARASALPGVKKQALDELIDERLKAQEAKRMNVTIDDADVDRIVNGIAERNKMTIDQFKQQLGGSLDPMKGRVRAQLAFNEVIRRRYGAQITVTSRDVDRMVANASGGEDDVELQIQRIRIAMPAKLDQGGVAQRLQEAEAVRQKFDGCKSLPTIARGVAGAKFEDLGKRKAATINEPTRTMLLNASNNEILPPTVGEGGVELWAVCGRSAVTAEVSKRDEVEGQLKQKQFELMAKRHLKDLRQDAHIEYR